jgi:hypothetical protein
MLCYFLIRPNASNLRLVFALVLRQAGLPKIRFHDLRHTAASLRLNHGIPVIVVSKMLGHSKPSITMDVYGHLYNEIQDEAAQLVDEIVTPVQVELKEDRVVARRRPHRGRRRSNPLTMRWRLLHPAKSAGLAVTRRHDMHPIAPEKRKPAKRTCSLSRLKPQMRGVDSGFTTRSGAPSEIRCEAKLRLHNRLIRR